MTHMTHTLAVLAGRVLAGRVLAGRVLAGRVLTHTTHGQPALVLPASQPCALVLPALRPAPGSAEAGVAGPSG